MKKSKLIMFFLSLLFFLFGCNKNTLNINKSQNNNINLCYGFESNSKYEVLTYNYSNYFSKIYLDKKLKTEGLQSLCIDNNIKTKSFKQVMIKLPPNIKKVSISYDVKGQNLRSDYVNSEYTKVVLGHLDSNKPQFVFNSYKGSFNWKKDFLLFEPRSELLCNNIIVIQNYSKGKLWIDNIVISAEQYSTNQVKQSLKDQFKIVKSVLNKKNIDINPNDLSFNTVSEYINSINSKLIQYSDVKIIPRKIDCKKLGIIIEKKSDGFICSAAALENKDLIGKEIISINGIALDDLYKSFLSKKTYNTRFYEVINNGNLSQLYTGLELKENNQIKYKKINSNIYKEYNVRSQYLFGRYYHFWDLYNLRNNMLRYKFANKYWYHYVFSKKVFYVKYSQEYSYEKKVLDNFLNKVRDRLNFFNVKKIILDLRETQFCNIEAIMKVLKDKNFHTIYVLVGPETKDSGIELAYRIQKNVNGIIIGENILKKLNYYNKKNYVFLNKLGTYIYYESDYKAFDVSTENLKIDIKVDLSMNDFYFSVDKVLKKALELCQEN